jgi:hypothetical protein
VPTLTATGPSFVVEGNTDEVRDVSEVVNAGHRAMTSHVRGDDGKWILFMIGHRVVAHHAACVARAGCCNAAGCFCLAS